MHEMLVEVVTEDDLADEKAILLPPEKVQEDIILDIENTINENRDLIRQNKNL